MNPEQVRAALVGIEQQARQYLRAKREGMQVLDFVPYLHGCNLESLNPRWLTMLPFGRVQSSHIWDRDPHPSVRFDVPGIRGWGEELAVDYFRNLKHAYLDQFHADTIPPTASASTRARVGLPELHPVELPDFAADIAAAPDPNNPQPPKPKAPKPKGEGKATAKDRDLSQRIARAGAICSTSEARTLRRAALTLHRWHELECGTDAGHIERDGDNGEGRPYFVPCGRWIGGRYFEPQRRPIADRERGALARIAATCATMGLNYYVQGDPRGCSLYVSPEPLTDRDYTRGVAVY